MHCCWETLSGEVVQILHFTFTWPMILDRLSDTSVPTGVPHVQVMYCILVT